MGTTPKKIQYAPGSILSVAIEKRSSTTRSVGLTARAMAERYVDVCQSCLPYFSCNEWPAIMRAAQQLDPETHSRSAVAWVQRVASVVVTNPSIRALLPGTEGRQLVTRLRSLGVPEAIATRDAVEQCSDG